MIGTLLMVTALASLPVRQTINLNQGWEFARVQGGANRWEMPDAVSTLGWRVVEVSSQESDHENGSASNAFDGDLQSFWHSRWSRDPAQYPHSLTIDLGRSVSAVGMRLAPRQHGPHNGLPRHIKVFLSDHLGTWGAPVFDGTVPNSFQIHEFNFGQSHSGRYLELRAIDGYDNFCVLSEIGLIRPTSATERSAWQSQYSIQNILTGDQRFDLSGSVLERVREEELKRLESSGWKPAVLPHTAHIEERSARSVWQGVCFYRKEIRAPKSWRERKVVLTLNGAMQVSDVWLNGAYIGGRRGGYLPVVIDLSGHLKFGANNRLLVRLDCRDNPLVPPGKPFHELDFSYYSGLYRDATITVTSPTHITDPILANRPKSGGVYIACSNVTSKSADVQVRTHVSTSQPAHHLKVRQRVFDANGKLIADLTSPYEASETRQCIQKFRIRGPKRWSPDSPHLYRLETSLVQGGTSIDRIETRFGVRSIQFSRTQGLILNDKPIRLVGTNRHQEYPYVGNALTRDMSFRDMRKIKDAGFNCVRLSHYPQDPAVMDACDELGILAIPAIAGWQFVNRDERFMKRVDQDIRELVRWHRNHPCILMWEASLNETYVGPAIAKRWHDTAHEEFLGDDKFTVGDCGVGQPWDMAYNGWDDATHSRPQSTMPNKPGYIREYGDYEFGGEDSTTRISRGQGEKAELQAAWNFAWSHNMNCGNYPWTIGDGTWVMYDYNRGCSPVLERSGIADNMRLPRFSYRFFQSQLEPDGFHSKPMAFIANYWTPRKGSGKVVVFSNCQTIELRLNGRLIGIQHPDHGPDTAYGDYQSGGNPWDGGNGQNLKHPAFTFANVNYEPGDLEAIGRINDQVVVRVAVQTPGKPASIRLAFDESGRTLKADGADAVFAYAEVLDARGARVTSFNGYVQFGSDHGEFLGEQRVKAEAGIAAVLFRAGIRKGAIKVNANAGPHVSGFKSIVAY